MGCVFCALPRCKPLSRPGAWQAHCPRWCRSISVSQVCHESAVSGVLCVSSGELISGCNPPGRCQPSRSQEDMVSNWEPAHSLVEYAISGAEITPCLLALAVTHLPLCFWWGKGPVRSQLALLWYSLNPLFCEPARLQVRLEPFTGKFSLFFLSLSLAIPQFGLVSQVSSLRLSSGHSGLVPTLSMQTSPPCPAPTP